MQAAHGLGKLQAAWGISQGTALLQPRFYDLTLLL